MREIESLSTEFTYYPSVVDHSGSRFAEYLARRVDRLSDRLTLIHFPTALVTCRKDRYPGAGGRLPVGSQNYSGPMGASKTQSRSARKNQGSVNERFHQWYNSKWLDIDVTRTSAHCFLL
jgi:hypothetical protein